MSNLILQNPKSKLEREALQTQGNLFFFSLPCVLSALTAPASRGIHCEVFTPVHK